MSRLAMVILNLAIIISIVEKPALTATQGIENIQKED
jgi:hypothetical protein